MGEKHILILKGSPRKDGNSSILADQVAAGAQDAGALVESFTLSAMKVHPCIGCDICQTSSDGRCAIEDDMQILYPKLREADGIVLASPVYWFNLSAQLKTCIDRWYALQGSHGTALLGKSFALVMAYGDTDPYTSGGVNAIHSFQSICRFFQAPIAGILYGTASSQGQIRQQPELLERAFKLGRKMGAAG